MRLCVCVLGSGMEGRDYMTHNVHVLLCALSVPFTPLKAACKWPQYEAEDLRALDQLFYVPSKPVWYLVVIS